MNFASVCSGIESPSVAWGPLGWRAQWFSEIAPFPSELLAHRYAEIPNLGDMEKIQDDERTRRSIDLLLGGTPCQSFSVAGLRKGLADPRGNLTLVYLRILERLRPRWMVWENVPGVLSADEGRAFGAFLGGLGQLGYGFAYRVLDAQFFGVPQRRRRVFVVGYLGDWRRAAAVLFERHSLSWDSPPSRAPGADVAGTLSARTEGGGGLGTDFETQGGLQVAPTLTTRCGGGRQDPSQELMLAHTLRGGGFDASEDGTGRGTPIIPIPFDTTQITHPENRSNPSPGDPSPGDPSPCLSKDGHPPAIAFHGSQDPDVSGDIFHPVARNYGQECSALIGTGVRRITPREAERLQGFADDYTLIPRGRRGLPAKDGPRYQAIGNSIAVPVLAWLGKRIEVVDRIS